MNLFFGLNEYLVLMVTKWINGMVKLMIRSGREALRGEAKSECFSLCFYHILIAIVIIYLLYYNIIKIARKEDTIFLNFI